MVIDTSAIFAAIANEPDGELYRSAIKTAPIRLISAVTLFETRIVLFSRLGEGAVATFDEILERAGIVVVPFDGEMCDAAFDAFRKFGKGQGSAAQLTLLIAWHTHWRSCEGCRCCIRAATMQLRTCGPR